ncbi:MOSC N-terminal beta barrel domain-containing protein [Streptomyces sp. NPDC048337]|uniref:MOSC N-terminal beta barrel domain-containing protein n=1 Tax=Streptomyces sp. NPDC048337 TaxID=3365535 RepID=UPI00371780C2
MGAVPVLGTVERIWRYLIKSTGGERLATADVDARGLVGDRLYAVRDAEGRLGSGKNTRRFRRMPGLLRPASRYPSRYPGAGEGPELLGRTTCRCRIPPPACGATWGARTSRWPARARSRTSTSYR